MSGHSKWSKIKHKKGAADAKRGSIFTKLGNAITVAAKNGGDPEMNFSLRLAIDKAKANNMPKENIERAIKRGTGESGGAQLEEIIYEGFGPNKTPIIIEVLTDNKNRAVSEIKQILEKSGGALAGPGSVMWQFNKKGVIEIKNFVKLCGETDYKQETKETGSEELELQLIDAGAEDIEVGDESVFVYTKSEDLKKVKDNLENNGFEIESAGLELVAKEKVNVSDETGEKLQKLFEKLEESDDVVNYYTNLK